MAGLVRPSTFYRQKQDPGFRFAHPGYACYFLLRRLRIYFRRNLANGAGELFGRLRAGHRVLLRKYKGRHARDAII